MDSKITALYVSKLIKVSFFLGTLFFSSCALAQQITKIKSSEWQSLLKNEFVEVKYKYADCNLPSQGINTEEVYLQFTNLKNVPVSFYWEYELKYGSRCLNCEESNPEMRELLKLNAHETKEGICNESNEGHLKLFSRFLNIESKSVLTDFNVKNIVQVQN